MKNKNSLDYGVCPNCGLASIERINDPSSWDLMARKGLTEEERKLNRSKCLSCNEVWGGLYRSALKKD